MFRYYLPRIADRTGDLSKSWFVYFYYRDPHTGKMKRFRWYEGINVYKTKQARKKAAQYIKREIQKALERGWSPYDDDEGSEQEARVSAAIKEYIEYKRKTTKKRSYWSYKNALELLLRYFQHHRITKMRVHELTKKTAQQVMGFILDRGISAQTHNNYLTQYRVFLNWCIEQNYCKSNPFSKLKPLKQTTSLAIYTQAEARLIRDFLRAEMPRLFFFTEFIYYTALRPYEIIQLKCHQITPESILVPGEISKNGRQEHVAVPAAFRDQIAAAGFEHYPPTYYAFGKHFRPGSHPLHRNTPMRHFAKAREKCGLRAELRMYHLKDLGAIRAIDQGISLRDLRDHLRHTSIAVTEVYLRKLKSVASPDLVAKFPRY